MTCAVGPKSDANRRFCTSGERKYGRTLRHVEGLKDAGGGRRRRDGRKSQRIPQLVVRRGGRWGSAAEEGRREGIGGRPGGRRTIEEGQREATEGRRVGAGEGLVRRRKGIAVHREERREGLLGSGCARRRRQRRTGGRRR